MAWTYCAVSKAPFMQCNTGVPYCTLRGLPALAPDQLVSKTQILNTHSQIYVVQSHVSRSFASSHCTARLTVE
jgi:hypothetical protein